MLANITGVGRRGKERNLGEILTENLPETRKNRLPLTHTGTWHHECLLKACASLQKQLAFCYKNSAPRHANTRHLRRLGVFSLSRNSLRNIPGNIRSQIQIAGPADFNSLPQQNSLPRSHSAALHQVADSAS